MSAYDLADAQARTRRCPKPICGYPHYWIDGPEREPHERERKGRMYRCPADPPVEGCLVCRRPLSPTCHDRSTHPGPEVSEATVRRWYDDQRKPISMLPIIAATCL